MAKSYYTQEEIKAQQRLNTVATSIEVPKAFKDRFPDLTAQNANKYFRKYLDVVTASLWKSLPYLTDGAFTHISTSGMYDACGHFQHKNERISVWNAFREVYQLFFVITKGSNLTIADNPFEKNSKVQIVNERLINMLLNERAPKNVFIELYDDDDASDPKYERLEIDMENLKNYIENTEFEISRTTGEQTALQAKLKQSLYQAQLIYKVGEHTEAVHNYAFLPMEPSPSPFGRIYYKGLNIQNVTKQVRSAVIGEHYQYDMNAAVYAVKLALLNSIYGGENNLVGSRVGTYTREYLTDKQAIRKRLAEHCFDGFGVTRDHAIDRIKQALTAIGFGAKTNAGIWFDGTTQKGTALTDILKSPVVREKFLNDPWVEGFLSEQSSIEAEILDLVKAGSDFESVAQVVREQNGSNGKVSNVLLLAYTYQQNETYLMDVAIEILAANNIRVKARIHDAFITAAKVPARVMDEIIMEWSRLSSHITLDCEHIGAWRPVAVKKAIIEHDLGVEAHKAHIAAEERRARLSLRHG
ncbi:hypothetical protein N6H05_23915 [Sphingobium sp. WTD-1]|uniref:hypothetical protein n=1 Tax=Sphingobium sp. WTD-1 TaxID=2979467 RepID=UPI0024DE3620|nr:hypothetical protein [Sphingobium sp. WTD-1]WIA56027.1 hypothetical protein N6H05_23915 [Sphingobium sp. WTD-1]